MTTNIDNELRHRGRQDNTMEVRRPNDTNHIPNFTLDLPFQNLSNYLKVNLLIFTILGFNCTFSTLYAWGLDCFNNDLGHCEEINRPLSEGYYFAKITTALGANSYIFYLIKNSCGRGTKMYHVANIAHKVAGTLGSISGVYGIIKIAPVSGRAAVLMGAV